MSASRRQRLFWLAIVLVAFGLRVYRLDGQGFWTDEAWTYGIASLDAQGILAYAQRPYEHPPVYYYLLKPWMALAGDTEFSMRYFSLGFSVIAVALIGRLARRWFSAEHGLWAGALAAIAPFLVVYAQEARMYIVALCAGLLAVDFALRWLEGRRARDGAACCALCLVGLAIHYYTAMHIIAINLCALPTIAREWRAGRPGAAKRLLLLLLLGDAVLAAVLGGWLMLSLGALTAVSQKAGMPLFAGRSLEELQRNLVFLVVGGIVYRPLSQPELLLTAGGLAAAAAGALAGWRARLPAGRLTMVCLLLIVPPIAASPVPQNYNARYMFMSVPALIWLPAIALVAWRARRPAVAALIAAALAVVCLYGVALNYDFVKNAYRDIAAVVTRGAQPGDAVILDGPNQGYLAAYYLRGPWPRKDVPADVDHAELIDVDPDLRGMQQAYPRIWIVAQQASSIDPADNVTRWLSLNAYPVSRTWFKHDDFAALFQSADPPGSPVVRHTRFGDLIELVDYGVSAQAVGPGGGVSIRLAWSAPQKFARQQRLLVVLRLFDAAGGKVWERVAPPCDGFCPLDAWTPGEVVQDHHGLVVPAGLAAGEYTLRLEVYQPGPGRALPVSGDAADSSSSLELARLRVR